MRGVHANGCLDPLPVTEGTRGSVFLRQHFRDNSTLVLRLPLPCEQLWSRRAWGDGALLDIAALRAAPVLRDPAIALFPRILFSAFGTLHLTCKIPSPLDFWELDPMRSNGPPRFSQTKQWNYQTRITDKSFRTNPHPTRASSCAAARLRGLTPPIFTVV